MSQLKSKINTTNKEKRRSLSRLVLMLVICFMSIITFAACEWTNSPGGTESSFDENGNLRVQAPYVYFNPKSNYGDSNNVVDDISGSFTWQLSYFINNGTKNVDYDQQYYLSNFYSDSKYTELFNYFDLSDGEKPKYFTSKLDAIDYYGTTNIEGFGAGFYAIDHHSDSFPKIIRVYTPAEKVIANKGIISFPDYEVVVDGKYYTFKVTLNTSYLETQIQNKTPFKDKSFDYDKRQFKEKDEQGNYVKSLFNFSYRVGKASTGAGDFIPCPEGFMTYYINDDNEFMIRFNPWLEKGSTNRYIKVRALTGSDNGRANSIYSNTVSFEAYTMTFSSYSPNSTSLDYGSLIYDAGSYHFHTIKEVYNNATGNNDIQSLVGVFPEGRRVIVERETLFSENYDYALQSWTMNTSAENSISLESTFPSITIDTKSYSILDYSKTGTDDGYYKDLLKLSSSDTCIPEAIKTGSGAFKEVDVLYKSSECSKCGGTGSVDSKVCPDCLGAKYVSPSAPIFTYCEKNETDKLITPNKYILDTIYDVVDVDGNKIATRSMLAVMSHNVVNGYKFYANFARVRNFTLSGTFFAGDNFFTGANQYLTNVTVSVFDKNGKRICVSDRNQVFIPEQLNVNEDKNYDGTPDASGEKVSSVTRARSISFDFDGAYFKIKGLEIGDYLMFEKIGEPLLQDEFEAASNLPYGFHSTQMVRLDIASIGINTKVLCVQESKDLYTDRQDIGIIGTQYAEESNLTVNLYQVDDETGEKTEVQGGLRLLNEGNVSYEVIKSVSSYEDKYGYITTNVIISILLPSNATLIGYNLETINESQAVYYSYTSETTTPSFILKRTYDKEALEYSMDFEQDLYSFSTSSIASSDIIAVTSGNFILYNDDSYTYSHNSTSGSGSSLTTTSFYNKLNESQSSTEYHVIAKVVTNTSTTWKLITYTKVNGSRITGSILEEDGQRVPVFNVDGRRIYQYVGSNSIATGEANEVSTIVSVYKTDMLQTVSGKTNNIYVYYDVKLAHEKAFYTSPIAKEYYVESDEGGEENEGSITIDIAYYFNEITNFDALVSQGKVMLGSQILSSSAEKARNFREALGSKIVQTCYYYIEPIGETKDGKTNQPITVLAKQYLQTLQNDGQEQVVTNYYYYKDGSYKLFSGQVSGAVKISDKTTLTAVNMNGEQVDLEKYKTIISGSMRDSSGILEYDIGYGNIIGAHAYKSSHILFETATLGEENQKEGYTFVENTDQTVNGYKIRYAYTLYEIVDGDLVSHQLYYNADTKLYYRIEDTYPITYPVVIDGIPTTETKTIHEVKTGSGFKIEVENASGSLLQRICVTKLGGKSTKSTYEVVEKSGKKTYTTYSAYLVPSYYVKNADGNYETQIYNVVSDGSNSAIPITFNISKESVNKYTAVIDGTTYDLIPETKTTSLVSNETSLVRTAQIANSNNHVTVLGKYIQTGDSNEPIVYPSFSNLNKYTQEEAFILKGNTLAEDDLFSHYYSLDYTSKKLVIEGFPGVSLLAGSPYPNPVIYVSVRHKKTEDAIVNISFDIKNAYYVEIMGTQIKTEDSNLIRDFTTYAFKDTITNLTLNDYIDKSYWILDAKTLKPVIPYVYKDGKYVPKLEDEDGNPLELSIQDVGINEDSLELFYADTITASGKYKQKVYMQYIKNDGSIGYKTINYEEDVILWRTDATLVEKVPMYDIHSYTQGKDGLIYFDSGTDTDDNVLCIGLEGISSGATQSEDAMFNYDKVLISGVTSAYRTKASEINISSEMYYGYWFDKGLNVMNAYNSNDAYFLSSKESVVVLASPTVQINDDTGETYIYRFKEWQVYSRYNSEVMYYNRGITERLVDRENAILRFTSNEAGYFVILPVYQRVYEIDLGTAVIDGAINQGGDINVLYSGGSDVDVEGATKEELYLIEYFKTEYNSNEGYYYSNILGAPYLWFTGEYDSETSMPIFEMKSNIYAIRFNQKFKKGFSKYSTGDITLYFELIISGGQITGIKPVRVLSEISIGYAGLVPIVNENGQYYICGKTYLETYDEFILRTSSSSEPTRLKDMVNHTFTADFFFDSILGENSGNKISTVVYYDEDSQRFYDFNLTTLNERVKSVSPKKNKIASVIEYILYWNMTYNSHIFSDAQIFEKIGKKYDQYYNDNPDAEQLTFSAVSLSSCLSDPIARSVTNYHTVMYKNPDEIMVGDNYYRSTKNSLYAGELAYDEDGNLYSTIQFKTAYIDRDTAVKLVASPDHGYRVEGWYMCVYDEEAGVWYTTDEKVQNSDNVYSDEILLAEYNEQLGAYYYVTEYFEERSYGKVYYFDEEKTEEAEVPSRMLDKVRGYFVNQGTEDDPNWIQVYKKGNGDETAYYYDPQFSRIVDVEQHKVEEKSFYSAIKHVKDGENNYYTLSNITIFRKVDEKGKNEKFYRTMSTGNIVVDGNTLIINKLHSNLRYVAKFIEVYTEYIFAEPKDSSGIEVKAVYYTTTDDEKVERDGDFTIIRTDKEGHNLTGENHADYNAYGIDEYVTGMDANFFNLYEQEEAKTVKAATGKTGNLSLSIMNQKISNPTTGKKFSKYTSDSYTNYRKLLNGDFGSNNKAYLVNAEDDELLSGELSLRNMYFDVHTIVYIVVAVGADAELTVHSLGFPPTYNIEPIIQPTEEFVNYNQSADENEKYDYLYYVFKISYDRNPQNPLASYEVHPTRYSSIAGDVLAGNYTEFYKNHFKLYDNYGNYINYSSYSSAGSNTGNKIGLNSYLYTLRTQGIISYSIYAKYINTYFDNIRDALELISKEAKKPGLVYVDYAIANNGDLDDDGNPIKLKADEDIFNEVRNIKVPDDEDPTKMVNYFKTPRLIRRGMQNTVNLSSIPIYSYTIQAVTVDGYSYDAAGNLVFTTPEEPKEPEEGEEKEDPEEPRLVLNNSKLHNLKNTIYTVAGTNNYTYLGYGDLFELPDPITYIDNKYSENVQLHFNNSYINLEYGEENEDKTILSDLPIAENTIMLLEGADTAIDGYAFVGWFEQKYNKKSNVCLKQSIYNCECAPDQECVCDDHECEFGEEGWSELTLMSSELNHPYLTLATADTVIVAVYKKVIDVSITYDNRELNVELPTGNLDSLGKDVSIIVDNTNHTTTISGQFYIDAYQQMIVSPVGGYRFDGFEFQVNTNSEWSAVYTAKYDDKHINYLNRYNEPTDHYDATLNGVIGVSFAISECLAECVRYKKPYEAAKITLKAKQLTLVYVEVDNFFSFEGSKSIFNGWNFALYDIGLQHTQPQLLIKTTFHSGSIYTDEMFEYNQLLREGKDGSKESHYYYLKDSAGNVVQASVSNSGTLVLSGYFDIEMSGNLLLVSLDGTSIIKKWYINGHINTTDTYNNVSNYGIPESRKGFASQFTSAFNINFYYPTAVDNGMGSTIDYNTNNYFALDKDNDVYYARAVIEAASTVTINHTFIESVKNYDGMKVGVNAGEQSYVNAVLYSILAYNGSFSYEDASGNLVTETNGTFAIRNTGEYRFSENTTLNISAQSRFTTVDGKLYVFIGWFESGGNPGDLGSRLISRNLSLSAIEPKGVYEAKYVRVHKIELDYNAFGQITVDPKNSIDALVPSSEGSAETDVFGYYDDGGYYYVMSGAELIVKAFATEGYVLPDFIITPLETLPGEIKSTTEDTEDYLKLTVHKVDRALRISANFDEGYNITINQMLYTSLDMAQDAEYLSEVYSYIQYRDRTAKTTKYVVPKNSSVKFSVQEDDFPEYYFLGWYIDNVLVSTDLTTGGILYEYEHTLTKDLVIEARFVPYINVSIGSRIVGLYSTVSGFAYEMTYTDLRTNQEVKYSSFNKLSLPAGIVVNLCVDKDASISKSYAFVAWRQLSGTTILKTFSTEKDANITLSQDLITSGDTINIYATFGKKVTLNLYKNISIRDEDKANYIINGELSDEFKSMFELVITYIDLLNNERTIRLGSNTEILDIFIAQSSTITIKYELSSIIADRYYLDNIFVKGSSGLVHTYTASDFEYPNYQNESVGTNSSVNVTATFSPSSALTISTELNGEKSEIFSNVSDVEYSFGSGANAIIGIVDYGSKSIKVPAISSFTLTATNPSAGSGIEQYYEFVGWYNGGTLITTDYELNDTNATGKITFGTNLNLIARYVALVDSITINRVFEGSTPTIDKANSLDVSVTGNFYVDNINTGTGDIKLQTLAIEDGETNASRQNLIANQKIVLIATHLAGYDFIGFEISQGTLLYSESYVYNSYNTVMELTPSPCSKLVINAIYKEKTYSVNYVITSYNSSSNEASISNYTKFIGPSESKISFYVNNSDFDLYVNGSINASYYYNGSVYVVNVPTGKDLTIELRYFRDETYTTKNAGSGNSWFISGAHQELYAVSHKSSIRVLDSDLSKLNLVSKSDPYANYTFDTDYKVQYFDGNTALQQIGAITATKNRPTEKIVEYNNHKYVFEGYWAIVGNGTSYIEIKVGSSITSSVQGTWANIVAKYRRVEEAGFTPNVRGASSTVTYVRTPYAIYPTYVDTVKGDGTISTNFAFVSGSDFYTTIFEKTAVVSNVSYKTYTLVSPSSNTYYFYSQIDAVSRSYSLVRNNVSTTINMLGTKINNASCENAPGTLKTATPTSSTNNAGDSIVINPINDEINVSFSVNVSGAEETDKFSTLYVNIYSPEGTYYEPRAITKGTGTITLKVKTGSTISLSYSIGDHKQFMYYLISGVQYKDMTYNYHITNGQSGKITIVAYFTGKYTASIQENDETKGIASLSQTTVTSSNYSLSIKNKDGFMLSAIYIATVESGYDGTYDYTSLYLASLDDNYGSTQKYSIPGMIGNISYSKSLSPVDDNGTNYVMGVNISFVAQDNIVIKIEYMHVSRLEIEVKEKNASQGIYFFYVSEFADPEVKVADEMTLAKLKNKIDNIVNPTIKDALNYMPESLNTFSFEGKTFDDTVYINHSKRDNMLITLNRLTEVNVVVYIRLEYEKGSGGYSLYGSPQTGVQVSYQDTTIATVVGSEIFSYVSAKSKPIIAEDKNGYFSFDGYYAGPDKTRDVQVSSSSDYVLLSTDFTSGKFEQQADGTYAIYALFTEKLLTITIESNYTDNTSLFEISKSNADDSYIEITTTKQTMDFFDSDNVNIGKLTYFYDEAVMAYKITYPVSLVKNNVQIYIRAADFTDEVTNDVYLNEVLSEQGITKFYQRTIKNPINSVHNEYYRFYRFVDAGGLMVGNLYTNFAVVSLNKYETGTTISTEIKQLYMLEYTYNYLPELFYIDMVMTILKGSTLTPITIATTQGQSYTSYENGLLRYLAEKDMNITIATHFLPGYDYALNADFESIIYSNTVMLSDILLKNGQEKVLGENGMPGSPTKQHSASNLAPCGYYIETAKTYWKTLLKRGSYSNKFLPVSSFYTTSNEYSKFESFNFLANENLSFVADFYNIAENIRYYILSVLSNNDYDGYQLGEEYFKPSLGTGKKGTGYYFDLIPSDTDYTLTFNAKITGNKAENYAQDVFDETSSLKEDQNTELERMTPTNEGSYGIDSIKRPTLKYSGITHSITTDIDVDDAQYSQTNLHVLISNVAKLNFSILRLVKNYQAEGLLYSNEGMPEETTKTKDTIRYYMPEPQGYYSGYYKYIVNNDEVPEAYSSVLYKVKVNMIDGYYFKGFIMVSSGYDATYDLMGFGGEVIQPTGKTFTYIPHKMNTTTDAKGNVRYSSAETKNYFTLEMATRIYALYEARVYVINLKTYEFKEDNEKLYQEYTSGTQKGTINNDKSMMTTINVDSAIIKGSLIVEHNQDAKLTAQTLMYMQFAGWATTKEYSNNDSFKVAFDTGVGLENDYSEHKDKNRLSQLVYNNVKVGYFDESGVYKGSVDGYNTTTKEFASSAARNNLYIYNLTKDIDIIAYFTYVSYNITINLADIIPVYTYADETTLNKKGSASKSGSYEEGMTTYLTYADYVRSQSGWKNPAAGTYTKDYNWGTNELNDKKFTTSYKIEAKDPYVYTLKDNEGNTLIHPTKIPYNMVNFDRSVNAGKLIYNRIKTSDVNEKIDVIKDVKGNTLQYVNRESEIKTYLGLTPEDSLSDYEFDQVYRNGYSYNQFEYVIDNKGNLVPKLNNIFNYITATTAGNNVVYSIKDGLFGVYIDGEKVKTSDFKDLQIDTAKGTIKFNVKVKASQTGLPGVKITLNNNQKVINGVTPHTIEVVKSNDTSVPRGPTTGLTLKGFNLEAFSNSDYITDPNYKIPNLDVEIILKWQEKAIAVDSKVEIGDKAVYLNGRQAKNYDKSDLACTTSNCSAVNTDLGYCAKCRGYEIMAYFIVIVENGQYFTDLLYEIMVNGVGNSSDVGQAFYYYAMIMGETACETDEYGSVYKISNMSTGYFVESKEDRRGILNLLNRYYNNMFKNLSPDDIFKYRVIDTFENFKEGYNINFYLATMNSQDLIVNMPLLQEHARGQYDNWPKKWPDFPLTADKGFNYYRKAETGFYSNVNMGLLKYVIYDNTNCSPDDNQDKVGFWKSVGNYIVGVYNGSKKYQGTYHRLLHSVLTLDKTIDDKQLNNIGCSLKITKSPSGDDLKIENKNIIVSGLHEWEKVPVSNALYAIFDLFSQPFAVTIIEWIVVKCVDSDSTLFEKIANQNHWGMY